MNQTFSCVIFDVDGTLTRTNELIFASFNHVARKFLGKTFSEKEIIALFGPPEEGALVKVFGREGLDTVMAELLAFYRSHHEEMAGLHPGIDEVLAYLKQHHVKLAVFTGKGTHTTRITLEALRIRHFFDYVVSGNDVVLHKPHGEGITRVLDHFGLSKQQVLMVGDSMADVKAARSAGVPMAAVLWDSYDAPRVLNAGTDLVFSTVDDMKRWCRKNVNGAAPQQPGLVAENGRY
jgi:pyrophosphatase PpaX